MHAQIENLVTCAHPKECVQPGINDFAMPDGTILEFCDYHANKLEWELPQWKEKWEEKLQILADAEAMHENLINEDSEHVEEDDDLEELLAEEDNPNDFKKFDFGGLDLDD